MQPAGETHMHAPRDDVKAQVARLCKKLTMRTVAECKTMMNRCMVRDVRRVDDLKA